MMSMLIETTSSFWLLFIVIFILYMLFGWLLTSINKLMYNKNTSLAWLPIINIYLLGKLARGRFTGILLLIINILLLSYPTIEHGKIVMHNIIPKNIQSIISIIYTVIIILFVVYAVIKYSRLKTENSMIARAFSKEQVSNSDKATEKSEIPEILDLNDTDGKRV